MFGRKKKNHLHHTIDTLIGANTHITGDINFSGGLRIDGHVVGNVIAVSGQPDNTLVLSNEGSIKGNIKATNVILNGTVAGSIQAIDYLDLQEHANVHGDVHYGSLEIQLGATVEGKMIHHGKSESGHAQSEDKMLPLMPQVTEQPAGTATSRITQTPSHELT